MKPFSGYSLYREAQYMKALKFMAVSFLMLLLTQAAQAQLSPGSKGTLKLDVEVQDELGIDTVSQVVELRNIKASEIQPFIQARLSRWGAVQVNDALNMVIITDKKPKLEDLVSLVHRLDSPNMKEFLRLETVSIPLNYTTPDSARSLVSPQLSPEGSLLVDIPHNALVITDLQSKIDSIKRIIEKIDVFVPQVTIESAIVEISSDYMHKVGIDWNALRLVNGSAQGSLNGYGSPSYVYGNWSLNGSLDVNRFLDIVNLLANQNKAKIISTTRIVTANGETGTLTAGQKVYFRQTGSSVNNENNQVGGLSVQIVPRIGSADIVTLDVNAMLDDLTGWSPGGNPIFENRTAKSKVTLKEGETFVLGGIERNTVVDTDNGIPVLKDILPFIFSSRGHTTLKSQVLVLLTPRIMRSPGQAPSADLDTYKNLKSKTNPPSAE
jgi:type II secretory pathway component GspD/PulD (secretin)